MNHTPKPNRYRLYCYHTAAVYVKTLAKYDTNCPSTTDLTYHSHVVALDWQFINATKNTLTDAILFDGCNQLLRVPPSLPALPATRGPILNVKVNSAKAPDRPMANRTRH